MTCKEYKDRDIVYHCKAHRSGDRYVCECGLDEPYTRTGWEDLTQEQRDKIMDNVAKKVFKIDKAGFYKNRKGEKVEIIGRNKRSGCWQSSDYNIFADSGKFDVWEGTAPFHADIIAHWEEPIQLGESANGKAWEEFKQTNAERLDRLSKELDAAHETDCESKSPKMWAVADNQGEWLEVTSRKEAGEVAEKWLKETPTTTIDIWEKISCYTAEVEIKEIKI